MKERLKVIKMGEEEVTTGQDAAGFLGVHPNTIRRWADEGHLPVITLPTGVRRFPINGLVEVARQMGLGQDRTFDINNLDHVKTLHDLLNQEITVDQVGPMLSYKDNLLHITIDNQTFERLGGHTLAAQKSRLIPGQRPVI